MTSEKEYCRPVREDRERGSDMVQVDTLGTHFGAAGSRGMAQLAIHESVQHVELIQEQLERLLECALGSAGGGKGEGLGAFREWQRKTEQLKRLYTESLASAMDIVLTAEVRSRTSGEFVSQPENSSFHEACSKYFPGSF